jgi:hypothetical protein
MGVAMDNAPIFQKPAVCLTKFGPESGETASAILARKEWERKSGKAAHANEFWWGVGEGGTAESVRYLIEKYKAKSIIFVAVKDQTTKGSAPPQVLVWRKYRTLASDQDIDIPENVLITSSLSTKKGKLKSNHLALVCKSRDLIRAANIGRFANSHYKNLEKSEKGYKLGKKNRGQRTTSPLVRCSNGAITVADCDSAIQFSAHFTVPYCVELQDSKRVPYAQILALNAIKSIDQWLSAVTAIRK